MISQAVVPVLLSRSERKILSNILASVGGVLLISILAHVSIHLPWTPVPITGQTLGVSLVGLAWGWKRGFAVMAIYLVLGLAGIPVLASAGAATAGYLFGMLLAASCEGYLSDRGWTRGFLPALATTYLGSALIFSCGLLVLANFVPRDQLLMAGLYPFLIGDCLKNFAAAAFRTSAQNLIQD